MEKSVLYQQIAETIRQQIIEGKLKPDDRLPTVREMAAKWRCTQGTVQRAYADLAREGLLVSRPGQGTRVTETLPVETDSNLRRAALLNRAESFLLEALTAGFAPADVDRVMRLVLDRWRAMSEEPVHRPEADLHFAGSHDPAMGLLAAHVERMNLGSVLHLAFTGSLGGLMALARGEADLAGCHLWDSETGTYNAPFVRRLLPGRQVALLTLGHRNLGLIVPAGNPAALGSLNDMLKSNLRFATRQHGTGTRVWLDEHLQRLGLTPKQIEQYGEEKRTHYLVAETIVDGQADVGIGIEAAAVAYGLDFVYLTRERYDIVVPEETWEHPAVRALASWLPTREAKSEILGLGGYDVSETGKVHWMQ